MHFNYLAISLLLSFSTSLAQNKDGSKRIRRREYVIPSKPAVEEEPTSRVFVKYRKNKRSNFQAELQKRSSRTKMHYDFQDMDSFVLTVPDSDLKALRNDPNVESVHKDEKRFPMYIPESVKHRNLQDGGNQTIPYGIDMVQAQQAWNIGATGQGVKVCVIDTGVAQHPDLPNVSGPESSWLPFNQDGVGHGTHCAGTIAAANNEIGVVGVAPDAEIISVKVFSDSGLFAYASGLLSAARKCEELGAEVISMSLGGPLPNIFEVFGFQGLLNRGVITVAAAGNFGNRLWSFPASYPGVVSVGAIDENKTKAEFSQFNQRVDIAAPGVDVYSTFPLEGETCDICDSIGGEYAYGTISGTSMACPHVAGVFALLLSKFDATPSEYIEAIEKSAEDLGEPGKDTEYGYGLVQAYAALEYLNNTSTRSDTVVNKPSRLDPTPRPTSSPTSSPTNALTIAPTNAPTKPPTNPPSMLRVEPKQSTEAISCDDDEMLFDFKLTTDNRASEVSWKLEGQSDYGFSLSGSIYKHDEAVHVKTCIPRSCYIFTITDSAGDGICCLHGKGSYSVLVDDNILIADGGDFGPEDKLSFGCGEYVVPTESSD